MSHKATMFSCCTPLRSSRARLAVPIMAMLSFSFAARRRGRAAAMLELARDNPLVARAVVEMNLRREMLLLMRGGYHCGLNDEVKTVAQLEFLFDMELNRAFSAQSGDVHSSIRIDFEVAAVRGTCGNDFPAVRHARAQENRSRWIAPRQLDLGGNFARRELGFHKHGDRPEC